ncbi:hypothetical protein EsH8_IV_000611 [Colletotrichum jinshuiense]
MLSCKACLKRALQPISSKTSLSEASFSLSAFQHGLPVRQPQRSHTTAAGAAFLNEKLAQQSPEDVNDAQNLAEKRRKQKMDWAVGKHLEHMDDPYKIAKHVEATLRKDRFDEALLLVQRASKTKQVVVAWNHLIEYQISEKKRVNAAVKLLNDMKKRGQLPNEQTYTIIFHGCAKSRDPKAAVARAVSIYNTMLKENQRVRPNSIHLNAVLQVCGRAGDLEAMFAIADTADPKTGRRTTAYTYTAIINTLRAQAESEEKRKGLSLQEHVELAQTTIKRCKAIWEEIMRNWRKGSLAIDEDLVCAMGRVLLLGGNKERSEIMLLLEETMSVRDFARSNADKEYASRMNEKMKGIAAPGSEIRKPVPSLPKVFYAVPRSNTLSLVLTVLRDSRQTKLGVRYWDHFVHYYGVKPDIDNWHQLIRIYERSGSSRDAAKAVQQLPPDQTLPIMYRRALSACINDNMNKNAFANATMVLDKLTSHAAASREAGPLDVRDLNMYLKVAMLSHFQFRMMAKAGDVEAAKSGYGEQLAAAVNNLWEPFLAVKEATVKPGKKSSAAPSTTPKKRAASLEELVELARKMIGAVDKVVNENRLASAEALEQLKDKRNRLNRFVVEFTDPNQQKQQPESTTEGTDRRDGKMWEF